MPKDIARFAVAIVVIPFAVLISSAESHSQIQSQWPREYGSNFGPVRHARPVLDQANTVFKSSINVTIPDYAWQQGITPRLTGQLAEVDLYVAPNEVVANAGPTLLTLSSGAPWQVMNGWVWQQGVTLGAGWNKIPVDSAEFFVEAHKPFTLGVHCPMGPQCFAPFIGFSRDVDSYPGGALYMNGVEDVNMDMMFQVWVRPVGR